MAVKPIVQRLDKMQQTLGELLKKDGNEGFDKELDDFGRRLSAVVKNVHDLHSNFQKVCRFSRGHQIV